MGHIEALEETIKNLSAEPCEDAIRNGTPIPDNATNGDVIKAMFPYGSYGTNGEWVHVFGVGGNGILVFKRDWWNAPYKESEEV